MVSAKESDLLILSIGGEWRGSVSNGPDGVFDGHGVERGVSECPDNHTDKSQQIIGCRGVEDSGHERQEADKLPVCAANGLRLNSVPEICRGSNSGIPLGLKLLLELSGVLPRSSPIIIELGLKVREVVFERVEPRPCGPVAFASPGSNIG